MLIARVGVGGEIPWHVHNHASEIAYVLMRDGILKYAEGEAQDKAYAVLLRAGISLTIPPGWRLAVGIICFSYTTNLLITQLVETSLNHCYNRLRLIGVL